MKAKTALLALFILLLVFSGCSDNKPQNTANTAPGGGSISDVDGQAQIKTPLSFLQCLNGKGVKIYSVYWCKPCHENLIQIFGGTGQNLKFKTQSEAEEAFSYFKNNIYQNCYSSGKCKEKAHYFEKPGSLHVLKFTGEEVGDTGCVDPSPAWNPNRIIGGRLDPGLQFPAWQTPAGKRFGIISIETLAHDTGCTLP